MLKLITFAAVVAREWILNSSHRADDALAAQPIVAERKSLFRFKKISQLPVNRLCESAILLI